MWDPAKYLDFADLRARPFYDLIGRIGATDPRRVVDLGCGPGNLTPALVNRWPNATIEASDNSPEMVAAARAAGVDATLLDVRDWVPAEDSDVVISSAVLQWLPEHRDLIRRWAGQLPSGAWFAMQVPGNLDAPSHELVRQLVLTDEWAPTLGEVLPRDRYAVDGPQGYADLLAGAGCEVDAWETTYIQRLAGENAVLEWITGTALRPIRAILEDEAWQRFRAQLAPMLNAAYPPRGDGTTWLPFRRVFAVAKTS